jgi:Tfp pilus assembly protein PilP
MVRRLAWAWRCVTQRRVGGRVRLQCLVVGVVALVGAVLATPLWFNAWERWQTHRERQERLDALERAVRDLRENVQAQPTAPLPPPTLSADAVQKHVQAMLTAQGLQVREVHPEPPLSGSRPSLPLCPWQVEVAGTATQWFDAYRHLSDRLGAVMDAVAWDAHPPTDDKPLQEWRVQLVLPCEVTVGLATDAWPTPDKQFTTDKQPTQINQRDAFSASQWQALHRRRLHSHPRAQALQRVWSEPASVLNTVTPDRLRYVGYMHNAQRQVALLQHVPESGEVTWHTVQVGQSVGAHWGEVTRITQAALEVQEWLPHTDGTWRSHRVVWPLQRSPSLPSSTVVRP